MSYNRSPELKSVFTLILFYIGSLLSVIAFIFLFPLWKLFVMRTYIVDPEQLVYAAMSAHRFGLITLLLSVIFIVAAIILRRLTRARWLTNTSANLFLVVSTIFLIIFVGENVLRILLPRGDNIFSYHHANIWDLKSGAEGKYSQIWVKVNEYGFRGPPPATDGYDSKKRYVFLGNSVTFGYNTSFKNTFPAILENTLNRDLPTCRYRIFNLAVPGYNLYQEYNKLKEFGVHSFERIFVGFCFNDVTSRFDFYPKIGGQKISESIPNRLIPWQIRVSLALKNRYAICFWGNRIIEKVFWKSGRHLESRQQETSLNLLKDVIDGSNNDQYREAWAKTIEELDIIRQYVEELDASLTILIYPYKNMYPDIALRRDDSYPATPLIEWAEQHRIDYIDLIQVISESAEEERRDVGDFFMDINHFNPDGHLLIAETLYRYISLKSQNYLGY